jgi:hypothetical protein
VPSRIPLAVSRHTSCSLARVTLVRRACHRVGHGVAALARIFEPRRVPDRP